jgi:pyruvyl transferase EpsO
MLRRLDALVASGAPLVLHGGGNFGDLYPNFNEMRTRLLRRYAGHPVVLLPQSVHFREARARDETLAVWADHGQAFAFLRDAESLMLFREASVPCALAPDLAHALWADPLFSGGPVDPPRTLRFMRRDDESADAGATGGTFDWEDLLSWRDRAFLRWFVRVQKAGNSLALSRLLQAHWYRHRRGLVERAVARIGPACRVETDRLHGMILAALMQRPVRFVDNSYGKLSRYHRKWLAASDAVAPASPDREAA